MEYFFIVLCIIIVGIIVICVRYYSNKKKLQIINNVRNEILDDGFSIDKEVSDPNGNFSLFVDNHKKYLFIYDANTAETSYIKFENLISFDLNENNQSVVQGRAGNAIIGGLLFGGVGAIVGASGKKEITGKCISLTLNICVNMIEKPNILLHIVTKEIDKNTEDYENALNLANELISVLKVVLNNQKKER